MADSVDIGVPAAAAWAFITDPSKLHELQMGGDVRLLSGTFDTVGSRYLVTTRVYGRLMDATHEIVRFEAPRVLATRVTSEGTVMETLLQVEPIRDDACVLIVQSTTEWGGSGMAFISRVMTALAGRSAFSAYLEKLRNAIEAESRNETASPA